MKTCAALLVLFSVFPATARADQFNIVGSMDAAQLNSLGQPVGPIVEDFSTSFNFDSASLAVTNMNIDSNGPLGPFNFASVTTASSLADFTWSSSLASIVLGVPSQDLPGRIDGTVPFVLTCLTAECIDDFNGTYEGFRNDHGLATATDLGPSTPAPEPSSLILLSIGLVGAILMSRRLLTS